MSVESSTVCGVIGFPRKEVPWQLSVQKFQWEVTLFQGFPDGASVKEPTCQCRRHKRRKFVPWVRKIAWRSSWQPTPVFLPGESHGQRSRWAILHSVTKSWTQLRRLSMHTENTFKGK